MSGTGELSRLFEIDRTTLNYYVKTGLLQAGTDPNQYHRYGFSDSMALAFIRYYRGLGFATEEIMCLLGEDSHQERLQRISDQIQDTKRQIRILQLKQWLLENLRDSFGFMEEHPSEPVSIVTEPYYFIYKKDMLEDSLWMDLYKMSPSIQFAARYDGTSEEIDIPDLFSYSGLSFKKEWLDMLGLKVPEGSIYYPAAEKYVVHITLSSGNMGREMYTKLLAAFRESCPGWKVPEQFIFYMFPVHYKAAGCEFECLCFLD